MEETKENTSPQEISKEILQEPKNRWSIVLIVVMSVIILFLLGYIAYQKGYIKFTTEPTKQEEKVEEKKEEEEKVEEKEKVKENTQTKEEKPESTLYKGKYLTAKVPTGWSIKEYLDGEGDAQSSVPLKGLTQLTVFKSKEEILSFKGIYGIGFEGCPELPHFPDSSVEYEKEQEGYNKEMFGEIKYTNYKSSDYVDFKLLGQRMRLVGNKIYYDTVPNNSYFEPQCAHAFVDLEPLGYTAETPDKIHAYVYEMVSSLTKADRDTLISILSSIEAK